MKLAVYFACALACGSPFAAHAQSYPEEQAAAVQAFEEAQLADDITRKTASYSAYIAALEQQKAEQGLDDPRMLRALFVLADMYRRAGSRYNSEYLHARLLAAQERILGADHSETQLTLQSMQAQAQWQDVGDREAFLLARLGWRDMSLLFSGYVPDPDYRTGKEFVSEIAALIPGPTNITPDGAEALNALAIELRDSETIDRAERADEMLLEYIERGGTLDDVARYDVHYRLGQLYARFEKYDEATSYLAIALKEMEAALGPEHPNVLEVAYAEAELLRERGSLARAEERHLEVLQRREAALSPEDPQLFQSLGGLARTYLAQGRADEASHLFAAVLAAQEAYLGKGDPEVAENLHGLAEAHRLLGQFDYAAPLFERAVDALRASRGIRDRKTLRAIAGQADNLRGQGEFAAAEALLDEAEPVARELANSGSGRGALHPVQVALANLYFDLERDREAERLFRRLLDQQRTRLGREHPATIDSARKLARLRLRDTESQRDPLSPARMIVAALRTRQRAASNTRIAQSRRDAQDLSRTTQFSMLADAAWITQSARRESLQGEVFAALQDAIAGPANRAIAQMAVRRFAGQEGAGLAALIDQRDDINTRFSANLELSNSLIGSPLAEDQAERRRLDDERSALVEQLDAIDSQLRSEFPDYFAMIQPEAVPIVEAQQLLSDDQAILLIVPSDFGTHTVAVTRDDVAWHKSELAQVGIVSRVNRLRWDLGANVTDPRTSEWEAELQDGMAVPYSRSIAFELYRKLIAPLDELVAGKAEIYIAAGGALAGLPFSVLITEEPVGADNDPESLRNSAWLADRHALVNIPSIQSLQLLKSGTRPSPNRVSANGFEANSFFGFGDPVLAGAAKTRGSRQIELPPTSRLFGETQTRSGAQLANVESLRMLASLPGTRVELEKMRALIGAPEDAVFLGPRATETAVRSEDLSSARILAFATHGITGFELDDLAEPGLVLTPPDTPTEADDGYLSASEVSSLRISAEWVILSACNTATGESHGLSGLSRAFFYAGAQNLLASHWPVDDVVASQITVRTIELQRDNPGMRRAQAFHQAMREIRMDRGQDATGNSWAHPQFWAPFVLIGGGGDN